MTLKEAVKKVIRQNISAGYNPVIFFHATKNGEANNLEEIISRMVLNDELLEELEKAIKKYKEPTTIEDLIAKEKDGFGLPDEVIEKAKARSQWFDQLRK